MPRTNLSNKERTAKMTPSPHAKPSTIEDTTNFYLPSVDDVFKIWELGQLALEWAAAGYALPAERLDRYRQLCGIFGLDGALLLYVFQTYWAEQQTNKQALGDDYGSKHGDLPSVFTVPADTPTPAGAADIYSSEPGKHGA